jgi:glycosyltransferase involved in cell wall biosynthesis
MPHFNHGAFIGHAVAAMQSQDRPPDEIVIVDDGSTDGSLQVIESFIAGQPTIRLIKNERNWGVNESIRRGVAASRGTFLFMASADDEVLPGLFREAIALLDRYPQAALCSGHCLEVDADRRPIGLMKIPRVAKAPCYISPERVRRLMVREGNWIVSGTTVYRKDRWLEAGGVRAELEGFGDEFLVTLLAMRHGACFVPRPFLAWRRVETGYAAKLNADPDRVFAVAEICERLMRGEFADVFPPSYARRWRQRWLFGARHFVLRQARRRRQLCALSYVVRALSLFVQMRPFDLWPTLCRWVSYLRPT